MFQYFPSQAPLDGLLSMCQVCTSEMVVQMCYSDPQACHTHTIEEKTR